MREVGRYALYDEIASGGMATVYLARQRGESGFARVVAVKMLHAQYAKEESFRAMFLDEARLVSRIRHPNVVATLDVVQHEGELFLVMDYVHGESLSRLLRGVSNERAQMPTPVALAIAIDTLEGLHAAHEATSEDGTPLGIVHRDVSPQNLLVGVDGVTHVADFGIAKAVGRLAEKFSVQNSVKGKAGYMAPEQVRGKVDRRSDVFAMGVVLWEMLAMRRLFTGESFLEIVTKALDAEIPPVEGIGAELDVVVRRALERDPSKRFSTAREMAIALEASGPRASAREVGEWMRRVAATSLEKRANQIARIERGDADVRDVPADAVDRLDKSVPGLAPSAPPARATMRGWVAAGAFVAGALGVVAFATRKQAPSPATQPAIVEIASVASGSVSVAAPPPAPPPPPPSETASVAPKPPLGSPKVHRPPAEPRDAGPCHYEQLPDKDGILIPKKVCP